MFLTQSVTYSAAFLAGLASFFSPCILPLVPAYFTFITGMSLDELTMGDKRETRRKVMISTISFVLGFSLVFVLMGATATMAGGLVYQYRDIVRIVGGIVIIILGLHVSGLFRLGFLDFEKRLHLDKKPVHAFGTVLVGMAFGAGWSPCISPILTGILAMATQEKTVADGMLLLAIYSAGMAIPFLGLSIFSHVLIGFIRRGVRYMKYVNAAAGVLLVGMGVLLIAGKFNLLV